jgi:antitoxin (DNA-binding transcriptional repressor) of toxin-antitoxin stability system
MKTATVQELRNEFPRIEAWVHEGVSIHISKRGKIIATLVLAAASKSRPQSAKVDLMARLKETWGERVFPVEEVAAMREDELAEDIG